MKMKKKIISFISFGLLFIFIYICVATFPLKEEFQLTPKWTVDLFSSLLNLQKDSSNVFQLISDDLLSDEKLQNKEINQESNLIPYKLAQNLGYFTPDGKIISYQTFPFKASVSKSYFTIYANDSHSHKIYNNLGKLHCIIDASGFPFLQEDRFYVFSPGGAGISSFDNDGKLNWKYESYVPIVSFQSSKNACVVGFADGNLLHYAKNDKKPTSVYFGGSQYQIILGADVSELGDLVACVCGVDNQRFIVTRITDGQSKVLYHEYLSDSLTERTFVQFAKNSQADDVVVFYQHSQGLGVFSLNKMKTYNIGIKGKILSVAYTPQNNSVFVLSKLQKDLYSIGLINNRYEYVGSQTFNANNAFLHIQDNELYIGKDQSISRFDLQIK